jgi:hypothetical protein
MAVSEALEKHAHGRDKQRLWSGLGGVLYADETTYTFRTRTVQPSDLILELSYFTLEFCYLIAQCGDHLEQFLIVGSWLTRRVEHPSTFLCGGLRRARGLARGRAYPRAPSVVLRSSEWLVESRCEIQPRMDSARLWASAQLGKLLVAFDSSSKKNRPEN